MFQFAVCLHCQRKSVLTALKKRNLRWDKGDCNLYYHVTGELFQNLQVPYEILEMTNGVDCGNNNNNDRLTAFDPGQPG